MTNRKSKLDELLPPSGQFHYHRVLLEASFFTAINPNDELLLTRKYRIWKRFQIFFMFTLCLRLFVECFLSADSIFLIYLGDFKIWWGEPYVANQVVWIMAAIVVPCYEFINLYTLCPKDLHWALPFQYAEGLKTAREIHIESEKDLNILYMKMRVNYYRSFVLQYSVIISYTIAVFVSYFIFLENYIQVFTLGIFWTLYETYWTKFITQNMGIYPACLEIITTYLGLRYNNVEHKMKMIYEQLNETPVKTVLPMYRIRSTLKELDRINSDLMHYNHYWRKFSASCFLSYIPQIIFELYSCLYLPMETSVFVFGVTLVINMVFLVSQVCIFSAVVIYKAYSVRRVINSIYIKLSQQVYDSKGESHGAAQRQLLRLSLFLEQFNTKQTGFHLLDFYIMDWNFYCNTLINCTIYFLLIVDNLQAAF